MKDVKVWMHKTTFDLAIVTPWWEILPEDEIIADKTKILGDDKFKDSWPDRKFKIGALTQVGWLMENQHGAWFGIGPSAQESFEDLGELVHVEEPPKETSNEQP